MRTPAVLHTLDYGDWTDEELICAAATADERIDFVELYLDDYFTVVEVESAAEELETRGVIWASSGP